MSKANLSIGVMIVTMVAVMTLFFLPLPDSPTITVATIVSGASQRSCMLEGMAMAGQEQWIIAQLDGIVDEVYVQSGDRVQAGQLLLRMDTHMEETTLAMLDQQLHDLSQLTRSSDLMEGVNLSAGLLEQRMQLVAAIERKQIRAGGDGIVENIYVMKGDYVSAAGIVGCLAGQETKVTAAWTAQQGKAPSPGMRGWWCSADGQWLEPLTLESVGAPVTENNTVVYPLVFRCARETIAVTDGEQAPVCLLVDQDVAHAVVPVEAEDQNGFLWLLRNGAVYPVKADGAPQADNTLQVQSELLGQQVVLWPDRLSLQEGMEVRYAEGM